LRTAESELIFFIDDSDSIPAFVDFALKSIQKMVGSNGVLILRGTNSGCVKKFYGKHDVVAGAKLGDLRAENVRTIRCKIEVKPTGEEKPEEVMSCELRYKKGLEDTTVRACLVLHYTKDDEEVDRHRSPEGKVQAVLQKVNDMDTQLEKLLEDEAVSDAIALQKKQIALLESVVEIDREQLGGDNKVEKLLKKAKADLQSLEEDGVTKKYQKEVHHRKYMGSRG